MTISRRTFLQAAGVSAVATTAAFAPRWMKLAQAQEPVTNTAIEGDLFITERNGTRIHTYVSPDADMRVNGHIIETANSLVVVDTLLQIAHAEEFAAYAATLGKPIERVINTHSHPDHWFGNAAFADADIYAAQPVLDLINETFEFVQEFVANDPSTQAVVASEFVRPTLALPQDTETIDGLTYEYVLYENTEERFNLVIFFPELGVVLAEDLLSNDVHLYTAGELLFGGSVTGWMTALRDLRQRVQDGGYDVMLVGHGAPAGVETIEASLDYLGYALYVLEVAEDVSSYEALVKEQYPDYQGQRLIDLSTGIRYGAGGGM